MSDAGVFEDGSAEASVGPAAEPSVEPEAELQAERVAEPRAEVVEEVLAVEAVTLDAEFVEVATEPSSQPETDSTGRDAESPAADVDATAPESDAYSPETDSTAADADSTQPDADSTEPDADSTEPDADSVVPEGDTEYEVAEVVEPDGSIAEVVYEADPVLLAAVDQARSALAEVTPASSIGELIGHIVEGEHVLSLLFESKLAGYPDWHWTATLSRTGADGDGDGEGGEPNVLEVELLPGDGSILSPAWVPWADRVTPESLIDDSENEFADDDVDDDVDDDADDDDDDDDDESDDAHADDSDGDDDDDSDDDDDDDDSDDDEDEDDEGDDVAPEVVAALALRRDRDGIDIDTIAEEGLDIDGLDEGELDSQRLIEKLDDAVGLSEESLAVHPDFDDTLEEDPDAEVDRTY
ncbi:DUF3027 domain-containing protein [Subtercola endophyticus]|uniref:DUF3027 domain-containing protein n=1 Tax=Subtercola endophyticus TaxID=2895559 RepID=UPI001E2AD56E|nr:DUF3027 domain-containing protein [Subtercola endophyticus]UFS59610.1 DUF3027 domain-containing protein [Subtercola endophyticus]